MVELVAAAEQVVIHGYVVSEIDGHAVRVPDPSEDAEPGDTVVAPVVSEPVALSSQDPWPMLRALVSHSHLQAQRRQTTPEESTGYYALLTTATNDPQVEAYGGRKITLPVVRPDGSAGGISKVIQVPYNAALTTVTTAMAAQTGLTSGTQVRAIWFADAAEYVAPPAGPTAYYSAAQVDSLLADLLDDALTQADLDAFKAELVNGAPGLLDTFGELAAQLANDESAVAALTTVVAAKVAKADYTAKGDILTRNGSGALVPLHVSGNDARVLTEDSTATTGMSWQAPTGGGSGGGGTPDLPEYSRAAQSTAVATPSDLLSKLTGYNTLSAAIAQPLPLAVPGRVLAIRWEAGANALSLNGATRLDGAGGAGTVTVTSGSATVSDSAVVAGDAGRAVTGTGIPAGTYVGAVTPGVSFLLTSDPVTQTNVPATASGSSVTVSDLIGTAASATLTVPVPGEVISLHCTHPGLWRTYSGFKPQSGLTALFAPITKTRTVTGADTTAAVAEALTVNPSGANRSVAQPTTSSTGSRLSVANGAAGGTAYTVTLAWTISGDSGGVVIYPGFLVTLVRLDGGWSVESTSSTTSGGGGRSGGGAAAPAAAGVRAGTYDPQRTIYTPVASGASMRGIRGHLARAGQPTPDLVEFVCAGDSRVAGTTFGPATSWPSQLRARLAAEGLPSAGTGLVMVGQGSGLVDSRITLSSSPAWTSQLAYRSWTASGMTATFVSDVPGTVVEVWYFSNSGTFTVKVDSAAAVAVTPSGGGPTVQKYQLTGLLNTAHTVLVTSSSTAGNLIGFVCRGTTGLHIHNLAVSGMATSHWATTTAPCLQQINAAIAPSIFGFMIGGNDALGDVPAATMAANLATVLGTNNASPAKFLVTETPPPAKADTWPPLLSAMYDAADTYGLPLLDLNDRYGTPAQGAAAGLLWSSDQLHETIAGCTDISRAVAGMVTP